MYDDPEFFEDMVATLAEHFIALMAPVLKRISFGVDKHVFLKGEAAIRRHLLMLKPAVEQGGYLPIPDHRIFAILLQPSLCPSAPARASECA